MGKLKEEKSTITISRSPAYDKHKLRTEGLDIDRVIKFNNFEKIEVTQKEFDVITHNAVSNGQRLPRWLIVHFDDIDWEIKEEGELK